MKEKENIYACYNADKQELFCIFRRARDLAKYLQRDYATKRFPASEISKCAHERRRIPASSCLLGFPVAIRIANPAQLELLGNEEVWVKEGYQKPNFRMKCA